MLFNDRPTEDQNRLAIARRGNVVLLTMPAARFDHTIRRSLSEAMKTVAADPTVDSVVLAGTGALFAYPAAPSDRLTPTVGEICNQIEKFGKPVVAALQGAALGQGVELALAAHWRVSLADCRLGLPDIRLGLVPGAGATQRLPRLIGAASALRLLQSGETVTANDALVLGLLDEVVIADVGEAGLTAARSLFSGQGGATIAAKRHASVGRFAGCHAAVVAERARLALDLGALPAAHLMVDCVEAAMLLPLEQGLAFEVAARDSLLESPEVQGLSHAARVERVAVRRAASRIVSASHPPARIALFGTVSAELVTRLLGAGFHLRLVEQNRDRLNAVLAGIATEHEAQIKSGRLTPQARDADWARLTPTLTLVEAYEADLWLCAQDARFATDTSTGPHRIFLGPAPREMPGLALYPPKSTGVVAELCGAPGAAGSDLALALCKKLGWRVVISEGRGGIESRMRSCLSAAILTLEAEGMSRQFLISTLASSGLGVRFAPKGVALDQRERAVTNLCLCALANEGARLVGEGVALCPGDVDAVAVLTGLVPRRMGGPLNWADQRGLLVLRTDLLRHASRNPALFTPAPLVERLIRAESHFCDLNRHWGSNQNDANHHQH